MGRSLPPAAWVHSVGSTPMWPRIVTLALIIVLATPTVAAAQAVGCDQSACGDVLPTTTSTSVGGRAIVEVPPAPATTAVSPAAPSGGLPVTGGDVVGLTAAGLAAVALGAALAGTPPARATAASGAGSGRPAAPWRWPGAAVVADPRRPDDDLVEGTVGDDEVHHRHVPLAHPHHGRGLDEGVPPPIVHAGEGVEGGLGHDPVDGSRSARARRRGPR